MNYLQGTVNGQCVINECQYMIIVVLIIHMEVDISVHVVCQGLSPDSLVDTFSSLIKLVFSWTLLSSRLYESLYYKQSAVGILV